MLMITDCKKRRQDLIIQQPTDDEISNYHLELNFHWRQCDQIIAPIEFALNISIQWKMSHKLRRLKISDKDIPWLASPA